MQAADWVFSAFVSDYCFLEIHARIPSHSEGWSLAGFIAYLSNKAPVSVIMVPIPFCLACFGRREVEIVLVIADFSIF